MPRILFVKQNEIFMRLLLLYPNLCNIVIKCVLQKNNIILCAARKLSHVENMTHTYTHTHAEKEHERVSDYAREREREREREYRVRKAS